MAGGARLSREARREQLVTLGHDLIAASSFEEVSVDDVAAAAGISRGLLFHYFPTKRDFQVAVAEHAAAELLEATTTDPDAAPLEQLRTGTRRFLDFVAQRPAAYVSLVRGAASGEAPLREVGQRTREVLVQRVLDGLALTEVPVEVRLVVRGWVAASEEMVVTWLQDGGPEADAIVSLIVDGLLLQLAAQLDERTAARLLGIA